MDGHQQTNASRRSFLKASAASACGALALRANAAAKENQVPDSGLLPITIAGYAYNRVRALRDKRVQVEGCEVTFEESSIGEMNRHAFSGPKLREVTEIGLSPFMLAFCNAGLRDYELLPIPIFHPAEPQVFIDRHLKVNRLFPDHRKVERAYFENTGIFPIMHLVAIRRDVTAAHPWLPKAVFEAYSRAKEADYEEMHKLGAYYSSLPGYGQEAQETRALMGDNFYPYGIEPGRKALETAFRYSCAQGLAERELAIEEVFNESALDLKEDMA